MNLRQTTVALREDDALSRLKQRLGVPANAPASCDGYLLRFLRNRDLGQENAISKLGRRREFERTTLPVLSITPHVVSSLRSRAISVIGQDILHRPVLYLRLGLHRLGDASSEEKLAIVVLEYMQLLVTKSAVQEFVLLINEEGTGWFTSHNSPLKTKLATLLQTFYPELVGQILVVNASWTVTQGLKQTARSNKGYRRRIEILMPNDLKKYIDGSVIPGELGGRATLAGPAAASAASDFCDTVLRYWFSVSSVLRREDVLSGPLKYPWMPLVTVVENAGQFGGFANGDRRGRDRSIYSTPQGSGGAGGTTQRRHSQHHHSGGGGNDDTSSYDDGRCSMIGDEDDHVIDDTPHLSVGDDRNGNNDAFGVNGAGGDGGAAAADLAALRRQLALEVQRRREAEERAARLQLGVPISDATLTCIEASLRVMHEEVNRLIGEAVVVATARYGQDVTLLHMVDMTDNAILQVIQEKPTVGAMRNAVQIDRKPKSSCVCS